MKLFEVLDNLYSYDIDIIVHTINSSNFAKDFPFDKENCFIIHTGFIFEMQNGKEIELFYDFVNSAIIRQPRFSENPPILGLVYFFWNDWIKVWDHKIVLSVNEDNDELVHTSFENANDVYEFNKFEITSNETSGVITINRLTKRLGEMLYFNGDTFNEIVEDEDSDW